MSDQGAFLSFLDWLDKPGQVVRNTLKGNGSGALKNAGDFAFDALDALLPGDWIPELADEEDKVSGADLVGIDKKEHPVLGFLGDLGVGLVTDPLTYVPGAAVAKGLAKAGEYGTKVVSAADKVIPGAKSAVEAAGRKVRATFGAERLSPKTRAIIDTARAARSSETKAGQEAIKGSVLGTLSDKEAEIIGDVMDNTRWENGKPAGTFGPDYEDPIKRIERHPEVTPENMDKLKDAVAEAMFIGQQQAKRDNIFSKKVAPEPLVYGKTEEPMTAFSAGRGEGLEPYLPKTYSGQTEEQLINEILDKQPGQMSKPNAVKDRKIETPEQQADFLAENTGVEYERNAVKRLAKRAEAQGSLAQRAEIGKAILGDGFQYADQEMRSQVEESIREIAKQSPEDAKVLMDSFSGIAPRGKVMSWLASSNRIFKPFAVYGAIIPKFGSIVRNKVSGIWQAAANPESRSVAFNQAKRLDSDIVGAVADSLGTTYPRDALIHDIRTIDEAMKASGGLADNAIGILDRAGRQDLAEAIKAGVLDGFVSSEQLYAEMGRTGWKKHLDNVFNWPGRIFRGVEDRMRLGMYQDLVRTKGMMPGEAGKIVRDSLYDYSVSSIENRRARDIIPFFQFTAKAIPQTAKLIAEKPFVGVGLAEALGSSNDTVYPWMEGKLNFRLPDDEQGNAQFATGFGLPFEALNQIPDSFRDAKRKLIGSSQPLLKSAFAAFSGEDPYFETPYGSYEKIPLVGEAGDAGSAYNKLAGAGLIQPIDSPLRSINSLVDDRRGLGTKILDNLTGTNVVSVDPAVAEKQQLLNELKNNPDIREYTSFYDPNHDPQNLDLIERYHHAKAQVKKRREQAASP